MSAHVASRIAIAHDYLNQRGGAERVVVRLAAMWPDAPIYTSLYRPQSTWPELQSHHVVTSWLDRLPVDRRFRALFPLYPAAFASLRPATHAVVVVSSSGWAHGLRAPAGTRLVVYCHTPARWLYTRDAHLAAASVQQRLARPLLAPMRRWDRAAARRAYLYVANSQNVRRRIRKIYDRDAEVVYPPVDVDRFTPRASGERLLVVSRLLDYKRVDAVIRAANRASLPLDVVGSGPSATELRALAGPTVTFHEGLDDAAVTELMESCRALVLPGEEDFGIVPVEAQAAGKPVVAFGAGGALETVKEGVTGTFFRDHDEESVLAALRRADTLTTAPHEIAEQARRFAPEHFARAMRRIVGVAEDSRD